MNEALVPQSRLENTETIERIFQEASSLETRSKKMDYLALAYYESKFSDKNQMIKFLEEETDLHAAVTDGLKSRYPEMSESELDDAVKTRVQHLLEMYRQRGLIAYVDSENQKLPKVRNMAGVFYFYIRKMRNGRVVCDIHFDKEEAKSEGNNAFSIQQSFEILVDKIVESRKLPMHISATSWLMGVDSLRSRMGFEVKKEFAFEERNKNGKLDLTPMTWGQFLDVHGNIKKEELMYLFVNGEPRYKKVQAVMSVDELFEKYGGKYQGEKLTFVSSEKASSEAVAIQLQRAEIIKDIRINFEMFSYEEIANKFRQIIPFALALKTDVGNRLLSALRRTKEDNTSYEEFVDQNKDLIRDVEVIYEEKLKEYLDSFNEELVYQF